MTSQVKSSPKTSSSYTSVDTVICPHGTTEVPLPGTMQSQIPGS